MASPPSCNNVTTWCLSHFLSAFDSSRYDKHMQNEELEPKPTDMSTFVHQVLFWLNVFISMCIMFMWYYILKIKIV